MGEIQIYIRKSTFCNVTSSKVGNKLRMMKKGWKTVLMITLVIIALPVFFMAAIYLGAFGHLQSQKELLNFKNATASPVLSADGKFIGKSFLKTGQIFPTDKFRFISLMS